MSFSGDLEHIPLIDVIQLLQQSGKSGTLRLSGVKGECQLGFRDGFIISASHVNTGFRVGSILVELGVITPAALELTLAEQARRGPHPPPLIELLVETGRVQRKEAYRGLQTLIELTIVEVLTWQRGHFDLDVEQILVADEYRYFPEHDAAPPPVSTQNVLMEALRIFDERKRDGTLGQLDPGGAPDAAAGDEPISADDLGLGDVESLRRRLPQAPGVPGELREDESRRRARRELAGFPQEEQERILAFLARVGEPPPLAEGDGGAGLPVAVILFTRDGLFSLAAATHCAARNIFVFSTDDPRDLAHIVEQSLARDLPPLLVIDPPEEAPGVFSDENARATLQRIRDIYPALRFIRLVKPGQERLALIAQAAGALTTLAKPRRPEDPSGFAAGFILFAEAFFSSLRQATSPLGRVHLADFRERIAALDGLTKPSDVSLALLKFAASIFPRAVTLLVSGSEVILERSIGLGGSRAVAPALKHHVPVDDSSVLAAVIDGGRPYCGQAPEEPALKRLHEFIGEPHSPKIGVLPLRDGAGRVLALTYGDFGGGWAAPVPSELLDVFTRHAALVLAALARRTKT